MSVEVDYDAAVAMMGNDIREEKPCCIRSELAMKFNGVFTVRFRGEAINEERMATEVILALDDLIAVQGEHGNHIYFDRWKDVDVDVAEDAGTKEIDKNGSSI